MSAFKGDSRARCKISSEYAFPIPLKRRGSVSERFNVWFSRVRASLKASTEEFEDFESTAVKGCQCAFALNQIKGCTLFRRRFG